MQRSVTPNQVQEWIVHRLARILDVAPEAIDVNERLENYGLESVEVITVSGDLSDWIERKVAPTILWDYPTISQLAEYIANDQRVREPA